MLQNSVSSLCATFYENKMCINVPCVEYWRLQKLKEWPIIWKQTSRPYQTYWTMHLWVLFLKRRYINVRHEWMNEWLTIQRRNYKPIRHFVCWGALSQVKPIPLSSANSQCTLTAHDMSIRPIQVELTNVFRSDRSQKLRCRNSLYCN